MVAVRPQPNEVREVSSIVDFLCFAVFTGPYYIVMWLDIDIIEVEAEIIEILFLATFGANKMIYCQLRKMNFLSL